VSAKIAHVDCMTIIGATVVIEGPFFAACSDPVAAERFRQWVDANGWVQVPDTIEGLTL